MNALASTRKKIDRTKELYRFRLFAAGFSSVLAAAGFVIAYYALSSFVPSTVGDGRVGIPHAPWTGKFDLAQLFGTVIVPPYPSDTTWTIGLAVLFVVMASAGMAYCFSLGWVMIESNAKLGRIFGACMFLMLGFAIWLAPGFQPAVMRGEIPDVGFFLLGWSGWATLALAASCIIYGAIVGAAYSAICRIAKRLIP